MSAIPFILITGFLGSGKTTFLKRIIDNNDQKRKIAIIQNEFAPANIDGIELKETGKPFKILELNNGSVFCVCLLQDFISSLKTFLEEEKPDLVILESSGLSDPIAITEILQASLINKLVYLAACWCIIDVLNFNKIHSMMVRVKHQITIADYLILNKTDQATPDIVDAVKTEALSINALAEIFVTSFCNISLTDFFDHPLPGGYQRDGKNASWKDCGRPDFKAGVFKTSKKIGLESLKYIISNYTSSAQRIKGYVLLDNNEIASIQTVFNRVDIRTVRGKTGTTALILMGEKFNLSEFSKEFRQLT
jgi:G3E family GTPase